MNGCFSADFITAMAYVLAGPSFEVTFSFSEIAANT
jgi:hypothetical protein